MLKKISTFLSKNKEIILLLSFSITAIIIGLILLYQGFDSALGRSGAVLVCIALISIYLNHGISQKLEESKTVYQRISKYGFSEKRIKENLDKEYKFRVPELQKISEQQNEALARSINDLQWEHALTLDRLGIKKSRLIMVEFIIGLIGTVVWGFGDLLPSAWLQSLIA